MGLVGEAVGPFEPVGCAQFVVAEQGAVPAGASSIDRAVWFSMSNLKQCLDCCRIPGAALDPGQPCRRALWHIRVNE
jgi:hypothetical protein